MTRLLLLAAVVLATALPSPARAEERLTPALALARICVSEAGWECFDTGDGLGIHEVLLRGAERHGIRYVSYARAYSSRATGRVESRHRPWVGHLRTDAREPDRWPPFPHAPWRSFRARWRRVLAEAERVVATYDLENLGEWGVCLDTAEDWGGPCDDDRAERLGLILVECGETENRFYKRPQ